MNPLHGFRLLWLSKISQLEALHAIYEAPRYILLHRQNSRLGIFIASKPRRIGHPEDQNRFKRRATRPKGWPPAQARRWATRQAFLDVRLCPCRHLDLRCFPSTFAFRAGILLAHMLNAP